MLKLGQSGQLIFANAGRGRNRQKMAGAEIWQNHNFAIFKPSSSQSKRPPKPGGPPFPSIPPVCALGESRRSERPEPANGFHGKLTA